MCGCDFDIISWINDFLEGLVAKVVAWVEGFLGLDEE